MNRLHGLVIANLLAQPVLVLAVPDADIELTGLFRFLDLDVLD
jgi:hypothetical protein